MNILFSFVLNLKMPLTSNVHILYIVMRAIAKASQTNSILPEVIENAKIFQAKYKQLACLVSKTKSVNDK